MWVGEGEKIRNEEDNQWKPQERRTRVLCRVLYLAKTKTRLRI